MKLPILQAVSYVTKNYEVPKKWTADLSVVSRGKMISKAKEWDIRLYIQYLAKIKVVNSEIIDKIQLYETRDLDAVFSEWNKEVTVSFEDVSDKLKKQSKKYIKDKLISKTDLGVIKYDLTKDGLFKIYKHKRFKCMNAKGQRVA